MMPLAIFVEKPQLWLPGPFLAATGVAFALLLLVIVAGGMRLASRRWGAAVLSLAGERVMVWILAWAASVSLFAIIGAFFLPAGFLSAAINSLVRLPSAGTAQREIVVPAKTDSLPIEIGAPYEEIDSIEIDSDVPVSIVIAREESRGTEHIYFVGPDRQARWDRQTNPIDRRYKNWTASNTSDRPATLVIAVATSAEYPEVRTIYYSAAVLLVVVAAYVLMRLAFPKMSAIAMASAQDILSQWLFWLVLAAGIMLLKPTLLPVPSLMHIPYSTFGEDIKMLKQGAVRVITVLATLIALWSASVAIAEELEGRTALTLLSKPVSRRQFLLGKFLGIVWPVAIMTLILGSVMLWTVSTKVVYDIRESHGDMEVTWQLCHAEMVRTAPAVLLGFFETTILTSIGVALSTRLPMLANLVVMASIYALGHIAPIVVQSSEGQFPAVTFIGQLIATVLPVLDHFDVPGAVVGTASVPASYLWYAFAYTLLYCGVALVVALALFEDRDLA